ncbi:MAG TPA: lytic transglycosylase domain-containing protein [Terriglobia bacterium]|nr:lytic transglycosylase domain-containing protein [Terriglobia bacterium]
MAENKIQAFVGSDGKITFTNLVDNAPAPIPTAVPKSTDLLSNEMPAPLRTLVDTIASNHGVDPALVRAVMKTESNFDRWATSPKGARGLMQLIPATARRFGVRDSFDPEQNVEGGVRYLKFLLAKFKGNLDLSLAAYNAGENLVEKLGRIPAIPETANYVRKIRAIYAKKSAPEVSTPATMIATAFQPETAPDMAKGETPRVYRTLDDNGVVHFSNIGPPN